MISRALGLAVLALSASSCGGNDLVKNSSSLITHVEGHRYGRASDQWIEMVNMSNEWEKVGLIFGYTDDRAECVKAIEGLKRANEGREYRCEPAN
ncbi:hypothetical protein M8312_11885 [Sphingomonas sp. KRR8]|uniref:hypothetical protein n=1 Tax=Sphingomonas sp. KRR8 TaxID=2942996 RepID=UPI0020205421|nr:hypothetical protein [Sphingomonas sp. KRR8]URD60476.1 hypothetical protein M8312_11885 [Sphingomonas sp. KRR8]